jgi:hypothetical protein
MSHINSFTNHIMLRALTEYILSIYYVFFMYLLLIPSGLVNSIIYSLPKIPHYKYPTNYHFYVFFYTIIFYFHLHVMYNLHIYYPQNLLFSSYFPLLLQLYISYFLPWIFIKLFPYLLKKKNILMYQ